MTSQNPDSAPLYDERLRVPLRWWVQATMFLASVWLAFAVALPLAVAWGAVLAMTAFVVSLFLGYGAARVRVVDGTFVAGRASIPVTLLGETTPLGKEDAHRLAGRDADARAYHLLRPYLKRAIRVSIEDPRDPTPYWLVSTRRPDALASALTAARQGLQRG